MRSVREPVTDFVMMSRDALAVQPWRADDARLYQRSCWASARTAPMEMSEGGVGVQPWRAG